jgi:hypothetical protein
METVNGLKLSYLLINNLLTKEDLTTFFKKLSLLHSSKFLKKKIRLIFTQIIQKNLFKNKKLEKIQT